MFQTGLGYLPKNLNRGMCELTRPKILRPVIPKAAKRASSGQDQGT